MGSESSRPMWEVVEGWVRDRAQELIQRILEEEVAMALAACPRPGDPARFGSACGLRVKRTPVAFLSFEDSPEQLGRIATMYGAGEDGAGIRAFLDPRPLWAPVEGERYADKSTWWATL